MSGHYFNFILFFVTINDKTIKILQLEVLTFCPGHFEGHGLKSLGTTALIDFHSQIRNLNKKCTPLLNINHSDSRKLA